MQVEYKNFDILHIPDNEAKYFGMLASIIENIDKFSYFVITKNPNSYTFRVSTSNKIVEPMIKQINYYNSCASIRTEFSKSIKGGNIFFKILL